MLSPEVVNQIAQAVAARLLPHPNGNGNGNTQKPIPKRLLTVKEAAAYIGRSESAIYHLVARREIAVVRHGRNLRFDVKELDRWIEGDKT
jgi:excisionase family DNA binding protein